jgi:parvulin-like peptidyl-prolyl isomerase
VHSLDINAKTAGGDMGKKRRGSLGKEIADFAFSAPLGRFGGPFRLATGWATVAVVERQIGDKAGFEKRRASLLRHARAQMGGQAKAHLLEQLRRTEEVTLDEAFLQSTGKSMTADAQQRQHPVATVSGHPIRYGLVLRTIQNMGMGRSVHGMGFTLKQSITKQLVDWVLLGQAALEKGFGDTPETLAAVESAARPLLLSAMKERLGVAAPATAEEIELHYQNNKASYTKPRGVEAAHILVADEKLAHSLHKRLLAGADFSALAREHSRDLPTKERGGVLGTISEPIINAMAKKEPELAQALRQPIGQVSSPIRSDAGWHLVKVLKGVPESVRPLAEVRPQIEKKLKSQRADEAHRAALAALRDKASISIDATALDRAQSLL